MLQLLLEVLENPVVQPQLLPENQFPDTLVLLVCLDILYLLDFLVRLAILFALADPDFQHDLGFLDFLVNLVSLVGLANLVSLADLKIQCIPDNPKRPDFPVILANLEILADPAILEIQLDLVILVNLKFPVNLGFLESLDGLDNLDGPDPDPDNLDSLDLVRLELPPFPVLPDNLGDRLALVPQ